MKNYIENIYNYMKKFIIKIYLYHIAIQIQM